MSEKIGDEECEDENMDLGETIVTSTPISNTEVSAVDTIPVMFEELCLVELSKSSWYPAQENCDQQTYLKGCKWSPDGTCCLTVVNNGGVHLLELPRDLYGVDDVGQERPLDILDSTLKIPESGLIYDFCWFPGMHSGDPDSCCWLTTRQHSPIQLWDAYDGTLRCSYRGYDAVDELEAAISLSFSYGGSQIIAGYKKSLKTFDVSRPGREYVNQPINSSASCICVSPSSESLIAVGSWSREISLYDIHQGSTKSIGKLRFHSGGVTHMAFLPDGEKLISGARKDSDLLIWDVRFYRRPYKVLKREVKTNQRIYFDVSRCGKYLVSGGTDGIVSVWNLTKEITNDDGESSYSKTLYPLHRDCCNGVSVHPHKPIIATSSGQHHILNNEQLLKDSQENIFIKCESVCTDDHKTDCEMISNVDENVSISDSKKTSVSNDGTCIENSLEFWWTGKVKHNELG